jgi:hypothetical protein
LRAAITAIHCGADYSKVGWCLGLVGAWWCCCEAWSQIV